MKDFDSFKNHSKDHPPQYLDEKIFKVVIQDLKADQGWIYLKIILTQGFIGFLTLLFCPQFSLSLTSNDQLFHYFHHQFGESICMAICGAIFVGSGALFAGFIMRPAEVRQIRKQKYLHFLAFLAIALSVFILLGAETYLSLTLFWITGALLSGILIFEGAASSKKLVIS